MTRISACALLACATALAAAAPASAATAPRRAQVSNGVLPEWARTGFSESRPRMPHTLGRAHGIVAILFGHPLQSPPSGRRKLGRHKVRVVRGGPGPSTINLPAQGCWRLFLTWSGRSDTLDLRYN